jgi:hypothetical protein
MRARWRPSRARVSLNGWTGGQPQPTVAESEPSLRYQLEMLERLAAHVDGGRPGDQRLLQAIAMLIAEKRRQLDDREGRRQEPAP